MPERNDGKPRRFKRRPGNGQLKTEAELARSLGERERTIRSWRHNHVIPCVVCGNKTIRYVLDDVLRALQARTTRVKV